MPWYVMHSKPNKEELLFEQLCIRNIEAYYPSIKVNPVNPRSRKRKPYFPGYLFVRVEQENITSSTLRWMPGALGLVDFGNDPAIVPDELVQAICEKVDRENNIRGNYTDTLKTGDEVTIQSGPFTGYQAIFDSRIPGRERVRVLLQLLSDRYIGVELDEIEIKRQA